MAINTKTSFTLLFAMLLLFTAFEWGGVVRVAEARVCQSQSRMFHGGCFRDHNCAIICRNEGFSGGRCKGFRRRCFCTRLC